RELSTWSQLQHKSIAPLLGLALFRGQLAMVSLWNKKGNVMKYMEQQPDLDRYELCAQVVNAVVYLHNSDVVHGDLKGSNILVSDDGTLQLTDFGLTIMHDTTIRFSRSTNVTGGTYRWMVRLLPITI
ncbi:kinase-like protein, partial [Ceratobasidium sp. AG-I]